MKIKDLYELIAGTTLFLILLVGSIIISNKITRFFTPNASRNINFILLALHLIMIVVIV